MSLDTEKIQHIASLARLKVSEQEAEHYAQELSKVFGYIDELKMVDVKDIEATTNISGLANNLRDDKINQWSVTERETALKQAERDELGRVKVKKIM
ncbi:MAG TPA: Asp-tRNA(Asn)/Glu-tRNA(Gln) amidotransferase subunit GatC [bacterium]|jgi:aspartyl-tRNA(Asn)/glutamyl-tRNA(Gln) amidotransferase subunit C|nr:Asp-tRNA(Asn)/Glu-tRNA(Gln) amidotransferase subunit GatC [bacterium]